MNTYKSNSTYGYLDLLKDSLRYFVILAVVAVLIVIWLPERINAVNMIMAAAPVLVAIYDRIDTRRLVSLSFDTHNQLLVVTFKTLLSKPETRTISFEELKLEVLRSKSKKHGYRPLRLYFLRGKREVFELEPWKDRIEPGVPEEMVQTASRFGIRIVSI